MSNLIKNKCPVCNSANTIEPGGFIPNLYAVKPIQCNDCGASFEHNIISRIVLWLFVSALFFFALFKDTLMMHFTKDSLGVSLLIIIGLFFALIIIGAILQVFMPWQFTLTKGASIKTKIINYGAILSMSIYILIYYVTNA